jgi:hypothetical protein
MDSKSTLKKLKEFWLEDEPKIVLISGLILVSVVAFEFGLMQGQKWQQKPLIIEKMAPSEVLAETPVNLTSTDPKPAPGAISTVRKSPPAVRQDCAFIGSKNSDKYHLPTCSSAKRIKPENVVCFKSAEEAAAKGYQPDKGCIK